MTNQFASDQPSEAFGEDGPRSAPQRKPAPRWIPGAAALLLALASVVIQAVGIAEASALRWELGTQLAWVAIALSVVAVIGGLVAVILNRGRRFGWPAVVLGVVANPMVLVQLFGLLG